MICPNFNDKKVKEEFTELVNVLGEKVAYHVWNLNNGYHLDKASNGKDSKLFNDLLKLYKDNRSLAITSKAKYYSSNINSKISKSDVDENNEPILEELKEDNIKDLLPKTLVNDKKFTIVEDKTLLEIRSLKRKRAKLRRESKDIQNRDDINKQILKIDQLIEEKEDDIKNIRSMEAISDLEDIKNRDFKLIDSYLEHSTELDFDDLDYIKNIIKFWQKAGDFTNGRNHIFFDEYDLNKLELVHKFQSWKNNADLYYDKLTDILKAKIELFVNKQFPNANLTTDDIFKITKDIGWFTAQTMDISEINNIMLQATHQAVKIENNRAFNEFKERTEELDKLYDKAKKAGTSLYGNNWKDLFRQEDENGFETGGLTYRISQKFWDNRMEFYKKTRGVSFNKAVQAKLTWRKNNEIFFDPRILFPDLEIYNKQYSEESKTKLEDELKEVLGSDYDKYYNKAKEAIETFKEYRKASFDYIESVGENIENAKEIWNAEHSPYYYMDNIDGEKYQNKYAISAEEFIKAIPQDKNGYYDEKYKKIERNIDIKNYHSFISDILVTLKNIVPPEVSKDIHINSLPILDKGITEEFSANGMQLGIKPFWNKLQDNLAKATRESGLEVGLNIPRNVEGEEIKEVKFNIPMNIKSIVDRKIELEKIKWENENGELPSEEWESLRRKELTDQISKSKSWDLPALIKFYTMAAVTYKHKHLVEDPIKAIKSIIAESKGEVTNRTGIPVQRRDGKTIDNKDLKHLKDQFDYYFQNFLGEPGKSPEGISETKKVYTTEEKQLLEDYNTELKTLEDRYNKGEFNNREDLYVAHKNILEERIKHLGGKRSTGKYGDMILKYYQLKVMGWNVKAGIANMGFGLLSNLVQGAEGRLYTNGSLFKAYNIVFKNSLLGRILPSDSKMKKKVRALMEKFDVLKDASQELFFSRTPSNVSIKLKKLAPYEITKSTEYINQAPIMIAVLMDTKVGDKSLWDLYDENGNLTEKIDESIIDQVKVKIDKTNKINHGNYDSLDSPLMAKKTWIGRAALQFRVWALMGFSNRFRKEYPDYQLGIQRKGRYRSVIDIFGKTRPEQYSINRAGKYKNLLATMDVLKVNLQYLIKKLSFNKIYSGLTFEDEGFTEVDAANMRANLTELIIYASMYGFGALISAIAYDDEDKEEMNARIAMANFLMNSLSRVESDVMYYISPVQMEQLQKNPIAVAGLVEDTYKIVEGFQRLINGEDIIKSGPDKDRSFLLRETLDWLPLGSQVNRTVKSMQERFNQ